MPKAVNISLEHAMTCEEENMEIYLSDVMNLMKQEGFNLQTTKLRLVCNDRMEFLGIELVGESEAHE